MTKHTQISGHADLEEILSLPSVDLSGLTITLRGLEMPVADALARGLLRCDPETGWFDTGNAYADYRTSHDRQILESRRRKFLPPPPVTGGEETCLPCAFAVA